MGLSFNSLKCTSNVVKKLLPGEQKFLRGVSAIELFGKSGDNIPVGHINVSDLLNTSFREVRESMRAADLHGQVAILPSGNKVIKIKDLRPGGMCGVFPGGVVGSNRPVNVLMKFNKEGDLLQLTAVQKTGEFGEMTQASTIRTADCIEELQKAGVSNPKNYHQVVKSDSKVVYEGFTDEMGNIYSELGQAGMNTSKSAQRLSSQTKFEPTPEIPTNVKSEPRFEHEPRFDSEPTLRPDDGINFVEEVPSHRKGIFGQDLDDPFEPLNKHDMSSLYYEDPMKNSGIDIFGNGSDIFGGGSDIFGGF